MELKTIKQWEPTISDKEANKLRALARYHVKTGFFNPLLKGKHNAILLTEFQMNILIYGKQYGKNEIKTK